MATAAGAVRDRRASTASRSAHEPPARAIADAVVLPVIASGGIAEVSDLVALAEAAAAGANIEGSIVGKALYAGRFTLPEALAAVRAVAPAQPAAS